MVTTEELEGGCTCRRIRYRVLGPPLFVHCCHCTWCQRETGASFALNAMIEADRVTLLIGQTTSVDTPSNSGRGQKIVRCPNCHVAVWSHYAGAGDRVCFLRVGTLDEAHRWPPDIHIFASTKQPWIQLPSNAKVVADYYDRREYWPAASLHRLAELRARPAT